MKVIDDKEVGEMWKRVKNSDRFGSDQTVKQLIRKLIDEEYWRQLIQYRIRQQLLETVKNDCYNAALKRYRIHPSDWKDDD